MDEPPARVVAKSSAVALDCAVLLGCVVTLGWVVVPGLAVASYSIVRTLTAESLTSSISTASSNCPEDMGANRRYIRKYAKSVFERCSNASSTDLVAVERYNFTRCDRRGWTDVLIFRWTVDGRGCRGDGKLVKGERMDQGHLSLDVLRGWARECISGRSCYDVQPTP